MGGDGVDRITGDAGNDVIDGGAGSDTILSGGDGNDRVSGGAGNDTLDGDAGNDELFGGIGNDDFFGGDGNDRIFGEDGRDELFGDGGNDFLFGGSGDDALEGDAGADQLTGGTGADEFIFFLGSFNPSSTFARFDTVLDFEGGGAAGGDGIDLSDEQVIFHGEESLRPTAGAVLPGAGNGITDLLYTVYRGDTWLIADDNDDGRLDDLDFTVKFVGVHAFAQDDFVSTTFVIAGTNGDDTLVGTEGNDVMLGLDGNDQMSGLGGDDEMHGGAGDDFLDGGTGFDNLDGGAGGDTLTLAGSDIGGNAYGGDGDDLLIGSDAEFSLSTLDGGAGNDTLRAGAWGASLVDFEGGDEVLIGGVGDDQYWGGSGADRFTLGATWTSGFGFQDWIQDFDDGIDRIDLRGTGLTYQDLTIDDSGFSAIVTSSAGRVEVTLSGFQPATGLITEADFLFV